MKCRGKNINSFFNVQEKQNFLSDFFDVKALIKDKFSAFVFWRLI